MSDAPEVNPFVLDEAVAGFAHAPPALGAPPFMCPLTRLEKSCIGSACPEFLDGPACLVTEERRARAQAAQALTQMCAQVPGMVEGLVAAFIAGSEDDEDEEEDEGGDGPA